MERAQEPESDQDEFQAMGHLPLVQIVDPKQRHPLHEGQSCQGSADIPSSGLQLQGNPILPPGRHHHLPSSSNDPPFRLKFMSMRQKFNKTTLPSTSHPYRLKPHSVLSTPSHTAATTQQIQTDSQLAAMVGTNSLIFRRLNNSNCNTIGKQRVMCSLFYDWRKQRVLSKTQPIWEWLKGHKNIKSQVQGQDWLRFDCQFESGNLLMVIKKESPMQMPTYDLFMQNDTNTKGCTQWFFFRVNASRRGKARFRLNNFYKPTSLYQKGMKILCCCEGGQWRRTGTAITYSPSSQLSQHYALEFIHEFDQANTATYFAYGYPYAYTQHLTSFLHGLIPPKRTHPLLKNHTLCLTAAGNAVPIMHINVTPGSPKPIIFIIARQHPGQSPASSVAQGLIRLLLSSTLEAKQLRERYEFRIVPMVNVDGVISGNYRSNLSGSDVNRIWMFPSRKAHPEVCAIKEEISKNKKSIEVFLDIHAHSRKMNSFFYASKPSNPNKKQYPFLCSRLNKHINYQQCSFADDPSKKTTARVVVESQLGIPISLTFEASFYGWVDSNNQNHTFNTQNYRQMGESLGMGLYYSLIGVPKVKQGPMPKYMNDKESKLWKNSQKMAEKWERQLEKELKEGREEDAYSEGSSLDPEHFQLREEEIKQLEEQFQNPVSSSQIKNRKKKNKRYGESKDSKLLGSGTGDNGQGISSSDFYHFRQRHPQQTLSVRELELELQLAGGQQPPAPRRLRGVRYRMGASANMDHYSSLDMERGNKNYKQDVLEMKKALKYLLENKGTDYEQYRSCLKYNSVQHVALSHRHR